MTTTYTVCIDDGTDTLTFRECTVEQVNQLVLNYGNAGYETSVTDEETGEEV